MNVKKRSKYAYLYIAPFFIVFVVFSLFPILYSLVLSFCNMDVLSGDLTFIGLDNYVRMIKSGYFFRSIGNTLLIWIMSIIPQLTIAFLLALILSNKWFRGRFILRNVYYFPNLVTPVTIGLLFGAVFSYPGGAVNNIIYALGLEAVDFQNHQMLARMVIAICWKNFGFNIIYFTADINSISDDVIEAAEVDGASSWQRTTKITIPLMKPILIYVLVTSIIVAFFGVLSLLVTRDRKDDYGRKRGRRNEYEDERLPGETDEGQTDFVPRRDLPVCNHGGRRSLLSLFCHDHFLDPR